MFRTRFRSNIRKYKSWVTFELLSLENVKIASIDLSWKIFSFMITYIHIYIYIKLFFNKYLHHHPKSVWALRRVIHSGNPNCLSYPIEVCRPLSILSCAGIVVGHIWSYHSTRSKMQFSWFRTSGRNVFYSLQIVVQILHRPLVKLCTKIADEVCVVFC
jgi:hypothetical protein